MVAELSTQGCPETVETIDRVNPSNLAELQVMNLVVYTALKEAELEYMRINWQ